MKTLPIFVMETGNI